VDEAIAALHAAIAADPKHPAAYDHLGTILLEQGRFHEAEPHYRRIVRTRPSAAAHRQLAEVLMRLGRPDEARRETELAKALDRDPEETRQ
jgi:cytochrome c-type biogenesis protein CcmH/NrfG